MCDWIMKTSKLYLARDCVSGGLDVSCNTLTPAKGSPYVSVSCTVSCTQTQQIDACRASSGEWCDLLVKHVL